MLSCVKELHHMGNNAFFLQVSGTTKQKILGAGMQILPSSCQGVKETAPKAYTTAITHRCFSELEGKSLLLKTSHMLDKGHGGIELEVTWKPL